MYTFSYNRCTYTAIIYMGPYPYSRNEGSFEVVGNTDEQGLPAGDHGHTSSEVADHMMGCQVHAMDVWV